MVGEMLVEVVYADRQRQFIVTLPVPVGCTIERVIQCSGVLSYFPEIVLSSNRVGIYGRQVALMDQAQAGDRIEIYRPLVGDPREIRRQRMGQRDQQ